MSRSIIHLNIADFAVAVERSLDSRLKNRPVIVATPGSGRARVFDMCDEAYGCGIRKGMPVFRAMSRCRDARVLPPRPARYEQAMNALVRQAACYSPQLEPGDGDGHLFLDVTGTARLWGSPMDIAWRLRKQARSELNLDPIWSVAPNRLTAKIASRIVKPSGEYIVAAGEESEFMAPLSLDLIPGIEHDDLERLAGFNLTLARHVAALSEAELSVPFGARARFIRNAVLGVDDTPVRMIHDHPPVVRLDHGFGQDAVNPERVACILYILAEQAGSRLRQMGLAARRVVIRLEYADGIRVVRQIAARPATASDAGLAALARQTLGLAWRRRIGIRHLCLTCEGLVFPPAQLPLFEAPAVQRKNRLETTVDAIRSRFGRDSVQMARTLAVT
ncbi:MAG: hypothetical protein AB7S77_13855 [Desulfatirhabdiaceae bacterium]